MVSGFHVTRAIGLGLMAGGLGLGLGLGWLESVSSTATAAPFFPFFMLSLLIGFAAFVAGQSEIERR